MRWHVAVWACLALLLLGPASLKAEDVATLGLEDVVRSALRHAPQITVSLRERDQARGELLASQGSLDPSIKSVSRVIPFGPYPQTAYDAWFEQPLAAFGSRIFAGYRAGYGDFAPYDEKLLTNEGGEFRAGVEFSLWRDRDIDERRARIERAEHNLTMANASVRVREVEITRLATQRYWAWVAAGARLKVAKNLLTLAEARQSQLDLRVRVGDLASIELVDNERQVLSRRAAVIATTRALERAQNELSLYLRNDAGEPILAPATALPASLPEPSTSDLTDLSAQLTEAWENHPERARLMAQRNIVAIDERLAENVQAPRVDVQIAASQDIGGPSAKLGKPELAMFLNLDVPLLRRIARGRSEAAAQSLARIETLTGLLRDQLDVAVRDASQAGQAAAARLELARDERERARQLEQGERARAFAGDSNLLLVNLREQTTADAELRIVDALTEYHNAVADMRAALAMPPSSAPKAAP